MCWPALRACWVWGSGYRSRTRLLACVEEPDRYSDGHSVLPFHSWRVSQRHIPQMACPHQSVSWINECFNVKVTTPLEKDLSQSLVLSRYDASLSSHWYTRIFAKHTPTNVQFVWFTLGSWRAWWFECHSSSSCGANYMHSRFEEALPLWQLL